MLPRLGLVTATAGGLAAYKLNDVLAASTETADVPKATPKKIRPSELPIYGEPEPPLLELIPERETSFHRQVSAARKWTWSYLDSVKDKTDMVKDKYEISKAHTMDALQYLQDDANALPRIAVITVAGLGGIVAGYKGGKIKKTFLATLGMAAAASVCYPREAAEIGEVGVHTITDFVKQTYRDNFTSSGEQPKRIIEREETAEDSGTVSTPEGVSAVTDSAVSTPGGDSAVKMDHGMSNSADKDMYTTRGN